jgi:hypothetical protein
MTIAVAPTQLFHAAVHKMLLSTVGGGVRVYDGNPFGTMSYPFLVVHDLGGQPGTGPPLLGDGADVARLYQLDAVGRKVNEAQELSDRCRLRMVQSDDAGGFLYPVSVAGWRCAFRGTDLFLGLSAEGREPAQVFADRVRYLFRWTPA